MGCGADPSRDTPEIGQLGGSLPIWIETVFPEPAAAAVDLGDQGVLIQSPTGGWTIVRAAQRTSLFGEIGTLNVASTHSAGLLVGTERGLFSLADQTFVVSPIQAGIPAGPVTGLVSDGRSIWVATPSELFRWSDGALSRVTIDDGALPSARVALAGPTVFIASQGRVVSIDRSAPNRTTTLVEGDVVDLAADREGTLHILKGDGRLNRVLLGGRLEEVTAIEGIEQLLPGAHEVWLRGDGGWFRARGPDYRPLEGLEGRILGAGGPGALLVALDSTLARAHDALFVAIDVEDGERLEEPRQLTVQPLFPEDVAAVEATLAGSPLEVTATAPWRLTVDPAMGPLGRQTLEVSVRYRDAKPVARVARSLVLAGAVPTWTNTVAPLYESSCALCHGASSSARQLSTREAWIEEIDLIIENVTAGRMPLPPARELTPSEVAALVAWRNGGFEL